MNLSTDFLKGLKLDAWYKAFVYIGSLALLVSLFVNVKGITNTQLQQFAAGILLVGLGEWKNHKTQYFIKPPNAYTGPAMLITQTSWRPDIVGVLLVLFGAVLIISGFLNITNPTNATYPASPPAAPSVVAPTAMPK
jgi:hypothetical protein